MSQNYCTCDVPLKVIEVSDETFDELLEQSSGEVDPFTIKSIMYMQPVEIVRKKKGDQ